LKPGYIVTVEDGSRSLGFMGHGPLVHIHGDTLKGRRWVVIHSGTPVPTDCPDGEYGIQNNTILHEVGAPENILFTRSWFCKVVEPPSIEVTANGKTVYISRQSAEALEII